MNRKKLEQLRHLKNEIRLLEIELQNTRKSKNTDCVTGSRLCIPYDKHVITISGVDINKINRIERRLERRIIDLLEEMEKLNNYIDTISNSEMRQIIQLRYRNGLSWQQIAFEIGEHDESYPRRKHNKFLELAELAESQEVV